MPRSVRAPLPPAGLVYTPEFLGREEEERLLGELARLGYRDVVMHGVTAKRKVIHFGWDYAYGERAILPAEALPDWLLPVRERAAAVAGLDPARLEQVLVAHYPPGAGIGWHRDAPMFGSRVVGVSLGAPAVMRFRRGRTGAWERWDQPLEPRSLYVLGGAARASWQHSIPEAREPRWSVTFRTLRSKWKEQAAS